MLLSPSLSSVASSYSIDETDVWQMYELEGWQILCFQDRKNFTSNFISRLLQITHVRCRLNGIVVSLGSIVFFKSNLKQHFILNENMFLFTDVQSAYWTFMLKTNWQRLNVNTSNFQIYWMNCFIIVLLTVSFLVHRCCADFLLRPFDKLRIFSPSATHANFWYTSWEEALNSLSLRQIVATSVVFQHYKLYF